MPARVRPLSPHLQIYRWQLGSSLSILHRFTGCALALGLVALCYWLVSLAGGIASYQAAMRVFLSPLAALCLIGWIFSFLYHLLNGMRHMLWDAGHGFERTQRHVSGWLAVLGAAALTLCVCWAVWHGTRV